MSDGVQRWISIAVGAGAIVLFAWIAMNQREKRPHAAEIDAGAPAVVKPDAALDGAAAPAAPGAKETDLDAGLSLFALSSAAATLPSGAPRTVKLGVVLVQYQGAEGASSAARPKRDALAYAEKLATDAKSDWRGAVKSGDSGSSEDIGRIPRGVLDPATEVAVFSLAPGEISGVLDTPRGYWIVKRAE